jgi:hypothetical protein
VSYSVVARTHADEPSLVEIRDVVDASFATWLAVQCDGNPLGLRVKQTDALSECDVPTYEPGEPNANSVIFIEDWNERGLPREAFGLTLVFHDAKTGEILDADMQLNETLGTLGICQDATCEDGEVDLQNIITHEAGHFLGLGHSTQRDACMYGKADVGDTNKRFLSHDDEDGMCEIYGGLGAPSCDAYDYEPDDGLGLTTCDDAPEASGNGGGSDAGDDSDASCSALPGASAGAFGGFGVLFAALGLGRRRSARAR